MAFRTDYAVNGSTLFYDGAALAFHKDVNAVRKGQDVYELHLPS